jgi:hypothetical protein
MGMVVVLVRRRLMPLGAWMSTLHHRNHIAAEAPVVEVAARIVFTATATAGRGLHSRIRQS